MKLCTKCKIKKDRRRFSADSKRRDGLQPWCKECHTKYHATHYRTEEKVRANYKERNGKWYRQNRGRVSRYAFLKLYGLSDEDRRAMYSEQEGKCKLCRKPVPYEKIDTDHDHKTGKIRGLLCRRCNLFVGQVEGSLHLMYDLFCYIGL